MDYIEPTRLFCPWDLPRKNTKVDWHFLLQRYLPDPGIKTTALVGGFFTTELPGKPHLDIVQSFNSLNYAV